MKPLAQQTILSHFSVRGANWPDRVAAAAGAGFAGVGLYVGEYVRLQQAGWTTLYKDDVATLLEAR